MDKEFVLRMIEELADLRKKYEKLYAYLGTNSAKTLNECETYLLYRQKDIMLEYIKVLEARLAQYHSVGEDNE